ncbi:hypothetical protein FS837_007155 [Tulasnella sp. UAMH 9824]|nr:hypothetical protein FS837_007155 [Tulasnella sp. UAMH 9824]
MAPTTASTVPPTSLQTPSSSILQFTRNTLAQMRSSYYGGGSRGGGGYYSGGRGNGFFNNFRRRINGIPPDMVFYGIMGINGAVFALWWYASESWKKFRDPSLYRWMLDNFTTSTRNLLQGRVWTLLTSCFSHEDAGHIFMNLLTFWFMGKPVLGMLGNSSFLALYLGGGLVSSFISSGYIILSGRNTGSHGASGAISAVLAFYATMFPRSTFLLFMIVPMPAWVCVGGLALYDLYGSLNNPHRRVDGAGHLGGFLAGFLYAMRLRRGVAF